MYFKKLSLILVTAIFSEFAASAQSQTPRTVMDTELGSVFTNPNGFSVSAWGVRVAGYSTAAGASALAPLAIKAPYTHLVGIAPADETNWVNFPYTALRNLEASEVAAGRPPIFVTASYQGKKRPVIFAWSLGLVNNRPTSPSSSWQYAVNLGDARFVNFWINQYIRTRFWSRLYGQIENLWVGMDQCSWNQALYGVIDNSGNFVAGVQWDEPFAQNPGAFLQSVASFFNQLQQTAPDIRPLPNTGSISDWTQFHNMYQNVPGLLHENMYDGTSIGAYTRNGRSQQYAGFAWAAAQAKALTARFMLASGNTSALITSVAIYSLLKGSNSFFDPENSSNGSAIPVSAYSSYLARLGNPTGFYTAQANPQKPAGYNLYSRTFDGGVVYLNYSGKSQTIAFSGTHYDPYGNKVSSITIPDTQGTFVTTAAERVARPEIGPRFGSPISESVEVAIADATSNATIHYTTDGSTPTANSPVYAGPFLLSQSAKINAIAVLNGYAASAVSTASYTIQNELPAVQFFGSSTTGRSGTAYPLLALSAVTNQPALVQYLVQYPNGTSTTGTVSFVGHDLYRFFPISASGSSGSIVTVTLISATGAMLGSSSKYTYTIQ